MNNQILETIIKVSENFIGNSNSLHKLGTQSKKLEEASSKQILEVLNLREKEIIYTSGRCESNNLVIFGLNELYKSQKNIIVTKNEPDSILLPLEKSNFEIKIIEAKDNQINLKELEKLIDNNTILVSISNVKNINEISQLLKTKKCYYHVDISDNYNQIKHNDIDLITIEDNDLPGFGCLIKNKNIELIPLFHGGKSTTNYRSGTPAIPFIAALSKTIRLKYKN